MASSLHIKEFSLLSSRNVVVDQTLRHTAKADSDNDSETFPREFWSINNGLDNRLTIASSRLPSYFHCTQSDSARNTIINRLLIEAAIIPLR